MPPVIKNTTDAIAVTEMADFRLRNLSQVRLPRAMDTTPVIKTTSEINAKTGANRIATPRAATERTTQAHAGSVRFRMDEASDEGVGGVRDGGVERDTC